MELVSVCTLFYSILPADQKRHFYTSKENEEYRKWHIHCI